MRFFLVMIGPLLVLGWIFGMILFLYRMRPQWSRDDLDQALLTWDVARWTRRPPDELGDSWTLFLDKKPALEAFRVPLNSDHVWSVRVYGEHHRRIAAIWAHNLDPILDLTAAFDPKKYPLATALDAIARFQAYNAGFSKAEWSPSSATIAEHPGSATLPFAYPGLAAQIACLAHPSSNKGCEVWASDCFSPRSLSYTSAHAVIRDYHQAMRDLPALVAGLDPTLTMSLSAFGPAEGESPSHVVV